MLTSGWTSVFCCAAAAADTGGVLGGDHLVGGQPRHDLAQPRSGDWAR
ncbi:MAG: hypothetical protein MZV65_37705 [Chromatiales bacterium]|nr:hypothetical protein [Chromatiales bacterium]